MGFRVPSIIRGKKILQRSSSTRSQTGSGIVDVPKGCLAVYVGQNQMKRFVIPVSFLNQPAFQELLNQAEEEFGYDHPMGALTIPCSENTFVDAISCLDH